MAPPKRKTGGRVTEKGTRPDFARKPGSSAVSDTATGRRMASGSGSSASHASSSSSRYTPPTPIEVKHSRPWVPALMLALLVLGAAMIMIRYLFWDSNIPTIVGLVAILAGLYTATKWR